MRSQHTSATKPISHITFIIEKMHDSVIREKEIDAQKMCDHLRKELIGKTTLQIGQTVMLTYANTRLQLSVQSIGAMDSGILTDLTAIHFVNQLSHYFKLTNETPTQLPIGLINGIPADFSALGVGGYKEQIAELMRTAFYSRLMSAELLTFYGITQHTRGVLLYGPTGTGKTHIAVAISKLIAKENVRVIEGPELKSCLYGQSQQNLANKFKDAYENPNTFYIFIFEEIDALFSVRGDDGSVGTSNNNDLVDRFLPIMQGPNSPNNILVIGTTNRKDILDPAVLRRFDCQIEINLPTLADRLDILKIQTANMRASLADNVDLEELAKLTENFNCAELVSVIDKARKYAILRNLTVFNNIIMQAPNITSTAQAEKVCWQYILQALHDVKPLTKVVNSEPLQPFFSRRN